MAVPKFRKKITCFWLAWQKKIICLLSGIFCKQPNLTLSLSHKITELAPHQVCCSTETQIVGALLDEARRTIALFDDSSQHGLVPKYG